MKVAYTPSFMRSAKKLKRLYPQIAKDIESAIDSVLLSPSCGDSIALGCRKLRWKNSDAARGKRGGYRIIFIVDIEEQVIYFLLIYSKSYKEDVTESELRNLISEI